MATMYESKKAGSSGVDFLEPGYVSSGSVITDATSSSYTITAPVSTTTNIFGNVRGYDILNYVSVSGGYASGTLYVYGYNSINEPVRLVYATSQNYSSTDVDISSYEYICVRLINTVSSGTAVKKVAIQIKN